MKYDAVLVLGRGVYKDGSIPESAKSTIEKAVELYKNGEAGRVIFSGRWTYSIDYTPPQTEAKAMADYASSLGLPNQAILLEEKSYTTVSNAYFIKKEFLIPNNWRRVVLVSVHPMDKRAHYVLNVVFGSEYVCDLVTCDFVFPPDALKEKEKKEAEKIIIAREFYAHHKINPGDHETIFRITNEDLEKNWRKS